MRGVPIGANRAPASRQRSAPDQRLPSLTGGLNRVLIYTESPAYSRPACISGNPTRCGGIPSKALRPVQVRACCPRCGTPSRRGGSTQNSHRMAEIGANPPATPHALEVGSARNPDSRQLRRRRGTHRRLYGSNAAASPDVGERPVWRDCRRPPCCTTDARGRGSDRQRRACTALLRRPSRR
jgi:hypothetical protein